LLRLAVDAQFHVDGTGIEVVAGDVAGHVSLVEVLRGVADHDGEFDLVVDLFTVGMNDGTIHSRLIPPIDQVPAKKYSRLRAMPLRRRL
jgi:hypothetical protein